jgi:predicted TIM-barrel fold metal-dependent hydrolase
LIRLRDRESLKERFMLHGYRILDADCHVIEPLELWKERLPPELVHRRPLHVEVPSELSLGENVKRYGWRGLLPSCPRLRVDGEEVLQAVTDALSAESTRVTSEHFGDELAQGTTLASQLLALRRMGVDAASLYPTLMLHLLAIDPLDSALTVALARAYNDWLRDLCAQAPDILQGVGVVSRHDPQAMVEELVRIAGFGWRAVHLRPNVVAGRRLSDPAYEPFWQECERLRIAVGIHEASHARVPTAGAARFETRFALHACSHPLEQMMAFLDLLEGGVLERHPDLTVAFFEAGAGWLPYWLWRLDREFDDLAWEVQRYVKAPPSEYFRRQCYIAIEPEEPGLAEVVRTVGADRLLFGSDYPHMDHDPEVVNKAVALEAQLGSETVRKILWDNPCRFYRWSPPGEDANR